MPLIHSDYWIWQTNNYAVKLTLQKKIIIPMETSKNKPIIKPQGGENASHKVPLAVNWKPRALPLADWQAGAALPQASLWWLNDIVSSNAAILSLH